MDYKLVKKLDEAGFPATPRTGGWKTYGLEPAIAAPNLSELIAACGESFYSLNRFTEKWVANGCHVPEINHTELVSAKTPEEAVAKLWLSLNKK